MFARVVVDIKNDSLSEYYDYCIPENLEDYVAVGTRVLVPFGYQDLLGYVIEITSNTKYEKTAKTIKAVLDFEQELTEEQISLARFMSQYYHTSMVQVLNLMIPSFLKGQKRRWLVIKDYDKLHPVLHLLFEGKTRVFVDQKVLDNYSLVKKEINKGNITLDYDLFTYGKNKKQKIYSVKNDAVFKNEKRNKIISFLKNNPSSTEDSIIALINCSDYLLKQMVKENYITYEEVPILLNDNEQKNILFDYQFSFDQMQTIERYTKTKSKKFLLFSNDEEFKLNFYLHIIFENNKRKLPTIFIAPTLFIAEELTLFLKQKLQGYKIVTMNSKNSQNESYETFMNVKYDNFDIAICTLNGLFLPFKNIGTIVFLDEENSYYLNENYPYYDACDIVNFRCEYHNARLVLTSSSPSIINYYNSEIGKYDLLTSGTLKKGNVQIVNMKEQLIDGSNKIISNALNKAIIDTLKASKQVILLVNSKAYSSTIKCRDCGEVLKCPTCNIPLTFYKEKNVAKCSYCDYKVYEYNVCPKCGSTNVVSYGYGLEQVKELLIKTYPNYNILQIDSDSLKNHDYYEDAITKIEDGSANIIIGTNIMSKYINNYNIGLVAILSTDRLLNSSDYRASEYTYNSIAKTISYPNVIIQTYYPQNAIIKYASRGDYDKYYEEEIKRRELLNYAPFINVSRIIITGEFKEMYHFANYFKKVYSKVVDGTILGPTYDYKVKGVKLIIKYQEYDKVMKIYDDTCNVFKDKKVSTNFERKPKVM